MTPYSTAELQAILTTVQNALVYNTYAMSNRAHLISIEKKTISFLKSREQLSARLQAVAEE